MSAQSPLQYCQLGLATEAPNTPITLTTAPTLTSVASPPLLHDTTTPSPQSTHPRSRLGLGTGRPYGCCEPLSAGLLA